MRPNGRSPFGLLRESILLQGLLESLQLSAIGRVAPPPRQGRVKRRRALFGTRKGTGEGLGGTNLFFSRLPEKSWRSFFVFAFRHPLQHAFELLRGPFCSFFGPPPRGKSGHFAKDILQKSTFAEDHFRNRFSSPPGGLWSDFRTPLGPPWDPSWSP